MPPAVTVIDDDVEPLFQSNVPENPFAVNMELPQLLTTDTPGALGIIFGAATVPANALVQPSTVCVAVYVPAPAIAIEVVVCPVFHNTEPETPVAVKTELPQLLTTDISGGDGMDFGAAV